MTTSIEPLPPPTGLSPSAVESFTSCPMAFRFANIERLDEPPTIHTARGSLVHRALELAYLAPPAQRTPEHFAACTETAIAEYHQLPDVLRLGLDATALATLDDECRTLVTRYQTMEDPTSIEPIGLEVWMRVDVGGLILRGIIDRLELRDGDLVVSDYKTGRPPTSNWEQKSLAGVSFYAALCEQLLGRTPAAIRLLYLSSGEIIETEPSPQSTKFMLARSTAVWKAVERACERREFPPRPTGRCKTCNFRQWCPAFGGDAELAHVEAPAVFAHPTAA